MKGAVREVEKIIIAALAAFYLLFAGGGVYSYFLNTSKIISPAVISGNWRENKLLRIKNYIENSDTLITFGNGKIKEIKEYIFDIIFKAVNPLALNPLFDGYNLEELKRAADNILDFTKNYLTLNASENIIFAEAADAPWIDISPPLGLYPSESVFFNYAVLTAEFSGITYYSPITVAVTIEAAGGADLSDIAVELLADKNAFGGESPFLYAYRYIDRTSWNFNRASANINNTQDLPKLSKTQTNRFSLRGYTCASDGCVIKEYLHGYPYPSCGDWRRFPYGADLYLSKPYNSPYGLKQQFDPWGKGKREGLLSGGRSDGRLIEFRAEFTKRQPKEGGSLPYIPIALAISRAQNSEGELKYPIIKIKIFKGSVWE